MVEFEMKNIKHKLNKLCDFLEYNKKRIGNSKNNQSYFRGQWKVLDDIKNRIESILLEQEIEELTETYKVKRNVENK